MLRMPVKLTIFLLVFGCLLPEVPQCFAQENQNSLEQQARQLTQEGKYQEAIPITVTLWPISDEFTVQIMSDFYALQHFPGDFHAVKKVSFPQKKRIRVR